MNDIDDEKSCFVYVTRSRDWHLYIAKDTLIVT